jgi:phage tail-like protein
MAKERPDNEWPLPKFHFHVDFGDGMTASFQEVSGLDAETDVNAYRHEDAPIFSTIKMPGPEKGADVTLKRGILTKPEGFISWLDEIQMTLMDEAGNTAMKWELANAFPTQIQGTALDASSDDTAIEILVLAHEGISISNV